MNTQNMSGRSRLYRLGGAAALFAMCTNLLDIILGFGGTEAITYGSRSALQWFVIYQESAFQGFYALGILNIVYMIAMLPLYVALMVAHRQKQIFQATLVVILFLLAMSIYLSTNAALPLWVLSMKYALADTQAQKAFFIAAGESVLARGEDFTPGSFMPLFLSGFAALSISFIMLRGGIFGKATAWVGIAGFTLLSLFTICATFIPPLHTLAFYGFASIGGVLALIWFALVARRLFQLGKHEQGDVE
ncbi:MAG TPA: hypothetical protein VLT51_04755 [Anaerolineales bacterium]|nr:hypothetical protein [Anaerolineales bacterium]